MKNVILFPFIFLLTSCLSHPPANVDNICHIFKEYPNWYKDAKDVENRWLIPVSVQMAIIHQESKFDSKARPGRRKLLWVIPWQRPSTAYGFSQALRGTWRLYKNDANGGRAFASRGIFSDAVDFVGWYANQAYRMAGIPREDAYRLYLAYHEGIGGFKRKTYLQKAWLVQVAHKVKARADIYQAQLNRCMG